MLELRLLNPHVLALLARVRHTNRLVVADCIFPSWPDVLEIDLSLVPGVPTVPQVLEAIRTVWAPGQVWMADEFRRHNERGVVDGFIRALGGAEPEWEPHERLKQRIPGVTGLIRTGETRIYTNVVLASV
jgi:D-ribose pyranase